MEKSLLLNRRRILLLLLCILLVGCIGGVITFERSYAQRFYPNISLGGEWIGGKSFDEVTRRLRLVGDALSSQGIQLVVSTKPATTTIVIPMRSTGLTPDVVVEYFVLGDYEAAARDAFAIGRSGNWFRRTMEKLSLIVRPRIINLPVTTRSPSIRSLLARELESILKKPVDAHFSRNGTKIVLEPDTAGELTDVDAITSGISDALLRLQTNRLQVAIEPKPADVSRARLDALSDFANQLTTQKPFLFQYGSTTAYASGATVATWLTRRPGEGVNIAIRKNALSNFLERNIAPGLNNPPRNSRFAMKDGQLTETIAGSAGSAIDMVAATTALQDQLTARYLTHVFPADGKPLTQLQPIIITVIQEQPRITKETIAAYDIQNPVGSASTSFKGSSAARRHNITKGAERVSGLLIAPGEEFSLVKEIGDVSEETGFEKEYVIKGDRSVKEAGGGLCQIATTVFRAALNAGLPITQRQNHSYVVGYYGPGLDATIYGPWPDLRFTNDTGQYLLFQMRVTGDEVSAEFYGKPDGRRITISDPVLSEYIDPPPDRYIPALDKPWGAIECTDRARKGLTAYATYTVTYADGRTNEQVFKSVYQPWPKICLVGIQIPKAQ